MSCRITALCATNLLTACVAVSVCGLALVGCKPPATVESGHGHEHGEGHEHPETYAAALVEIKELRESVQNAFAAGKAAETDDSLHEIGHLLNDLPELAERAGLAGDDLTSVKESADRVFMAYEELHIPVHEGKDVSADAYDDVAETIDSGLAELEAKLSLIDDEHEVHHDEADNEH